MKKTTLLLILAFSIIGCFQEQDSKEKEPDQKNPYEQYIENVDFIAGNDYLRKWNGHNQYEPFFINAMNLGVGVPEKQPGELVYLTKEQYKRWFSQTANLGINIIRVYNLHGPQFYEALAEYNAENSSDPMYIFQGVWLDYYAGEDLYDFSDEFKEEIRFTVDAVYGDEFTIEEVIDNRIGKAYGPYTTNASQWVLGWILGREVEPYEIDKTNENHDKTSFTGKYFSISDVNPSTVWIVEKLDYTVNYEMENHNRERPISFSSWPTLDPIDHPSEKEGSVDDQEELELYKIEKSESKAGYFASYHAYPYYPDFMNNSSTYEDYEDGYGKNPYIGYLTELKSYYKNIPLFIAEYGVPSSWGNAKFSISGMDHGGHSEEMQGIYAVRMLRNMYETNCAGGAYFALFDEWWKNAWINEPTTFPFSDYKLWHDVTNPEQNYGLITFEPKILVKKDVPFLAGEETEYFDNVSMQADTHFLTVDIKLKDISLNISENVSDKIYILIDTYGDIDGENEGERKIPLRDDFQIELKRGGEFLVEIDIAEKRANLYVAEDYDLFGVWFDLNKKWHPQNSSTGNWNLVRWQNSYINSDEKTYIQQIGRLKVRYNYEDSSNLDAVILDGWRNVKLRLPWNLLQFSNPSDREIFWGDKDKLETGSRETDGVAVSLVFSRDTGDSDETKRFIDDTVETEKFNWDSWHNVRFFNEREKKSYSIFRQKAAELMREIGYNLRP